MNKPAFRIYGGKATIAPWIVSLMPKHTIYVEPYGGALSVLFHKTQSKIEIVNDFNPEIHNFFRVLRDHKSELIDKIYFTPFSRKELSIAFKPTKNSVERARRFYVRAWQNWMGATTDKMSFRKNSSLKSWTSPSVTWKNVEHLYTIAERLRSVTIENLPATKIIKEYDTEDTLHFIDPPYPAQTRSERWSKIAYGKKYELQKKDHIELSQILHSLSGMVMICSYRNDMYDILYKDWNVQAKQMMTMSHKQKLEHIYLSPTLMKRISQGRLFE